MVAFFHQEYFFYSPNKTTMKFRKIYFLLAAVCLWTACTNSENDVSKMPEAYKNPTVISNTAKIIDNPNDPESYYERAMSLVNIQADSLAIVDFEKAVMMDPANFKFKYRYANFLFEIKEFAKAAEQYEMLIKLDPMSEDAILGLVQTYIKLEDAKNANKYLAPPLRTMPDNAVLVYFTAEIALVEKDTTKALNILDQLLKKDNSFYVANFLKGEILAKRNQESNIQYFEKAFQTDTLDALPIEKIGDFYFERKDYGNAMKYYKQTLKIDNSYEYGFYKAGKTYLMMDSLDKALSNYNIALQSNILYLDAYIGKAEVFEKMNLADSALNMYQQALRFHPKSEKAKEGIAKLKK